MDVLWGKLVSDLCSSFITLNLIYYEFAKSFWLDILFILGFLKVSVNILYVRNLYCM